MGRAMRNHLNVVGVGNWYRFPNINISEFITICKTELNFDFFEYYYTYICKTTSN